MPLDEYVSRAVYTIIRSCPGAPQSLGYKSIWDVPTTTVSWLLENISEEYK